MHIHIIQSTKSRLQHHPSFSSQGQARIQGGGASPPPLDSSEFSIISIFGITVRNLF